MSRIPFIIFIIFGMAHGSSRTPDPFFRETVQRLLYQPGLPAASEGKGKRYSGKSKMNGYCVF
jgi:hypothetical protein